MWRKVVIALLVASALVIAVVYRSRSNYAVVQRDLARVDVRAIVHEAERYRLANPHEACPTVALLVEKGRLTGAAAEGIDPWGTPFRLICTPGVSVTSIGADRVEGTSDDIRSEDDR